MSSQEYIKSISEIIPDNNLPSLSKGQNIDKSINSSSFMSNFSFINNLSLQTWVIIILILALLGINIFVYLAKGTQETALIFRQIFAPILTLFGYNTLETTKQTIDTSATGTKTGVDIVAGTATGAINKVQQNVLSPVATSGTSTGVSGKMSSSSLSNHQENVYNKQDEYNVRDSLSRALENAKQPNNVSPDDSRSSIQTTGKSGWCYIGEEQGVRTCSEVGVNDVCMSGDVFPNQAICVNPNLRA